MMLTYYYAPTSCALGGHIALEEAGAEYLPERVNLLKPDVVEAYRKKNPKGTVPALLVGDRILTESTAILWYVAQAYPAAELWPRAPLEQAECLSVMSWLASSVHIARRQARAPHRFTDDAAAHDALRASGAATFLKHLERLNALYQGKEWLIGDRFSVVDCYVMVYLQWATMDEVDMGRLPALADLLERMLQRPATRRVLERERSILVR